MCGPRGGPDTRRREQIPRSVGDLSAFRPYLGDGGDRNRKRELRIAALFFAIALVLLLLPNVYRENIARSMRATLLRPILAMQQGAVERNTLFDDPARLRAERDSLAAFLVGNATLESENRRLRELLGLQERLPPAFVPAEIVRVPGRGSEGFFQLTAGADQGIAAGASIVAAEGLVGRVRELDGSLAFGIDWMHPEFRASAMTLDGEIYGIVEPRRVGGEPLLVLTGTPRHVQLESGEVIVTSGHGGVFPRGVPIGTVIGQEGGAEGWQRNYLIQPLVAPSEMTYVLVLGGPQRAMEGQDLASTWGIRPTETNRDTAQISGQGTAGAAAGAPQPATPAPTPAQPTQSEPEPDPDGANGGPSLLGEPVQPQ